MSSGMRSGTATADLDRLALALAATLGGAPPTLTPLRHNGVAHVHYRIGTTGLLARIPRFSQWDRSGVRDGAEHLAYQAAAFSRAQSSGHTPRLEALLPVSEDAPTGALIVEEIIGTPPQLSDAPAPHMAAIAQALSALHRAPVPAPEAALPLLFHTDPVSQTLEVITAQAAYLADAGLAPVARAGLEEELAWAKDWAGEPDRPPGPIAICGTDTHPGNFIIDGAGKAWFVDLEKLLYGSPAIDLAHATLPSSTGWEPRCAVTLSRENIAEFYAQYKSTLSQQAAAKLAPWLAPMRRLTWLRSLTWFARWRADWSQAKNSALADADQARHIENHIAACFNPDAIAAMRAEWART